MSDMRWKFTSMSMNDALFIVRSTVSEEAEGFRAELCACSRGDSQSTSKPKVGELSARSVVEIYCAKHSQRGSRRLSSLALRICHVSPDDFLPAPKILSE